MSRDTVISCGTHYKWSGDIAVITFNFTPVIPSGETLASQVSHVYDMAGTDMDSTMLVASSVNGNYVVVKIQAGTKGSSYRVVSAGTMSGGAKYYAAVLVEVVA